jgi:hypothetical protein
MLVKVERSQYIEKRFRVRVVSVSVNVEVTRDDDFRRRRNKVFQQSLKFVEENDKIR